MGYTRGRKPQQSTLLWFKKNIRKRLCDAGVSATVAEKLTEMLKDYEVKYARDKTASDEKAAEELFYPLLERSRGMHEVVAPKVEVNRKRPLDVKFVQKLTEQKLMSKGVSPEEAEDFVKRNVKPWTWKSAWSGSSKSKEDVADSYSNRMVELYEAKKRIASKKK